MSRRIQSALLALSLALACGGGDDAWVAEVDERSITPGELLRAVEPRVAASPQTNRADVVHEELERLVSERAALNRAEQLGIAVSDSEVDARIRELVGPDGEISSELSGPEYRDELRRQMTLDRVAVRELAGKVEISEGTLAQYFEENKERLRKPPRIRIRQIVVQDEAKASRLLAQLQAGADFAELARAESVAPEATKGGELPAFAEGEMPEAFDRAFKLGVGQISNVVASPFGYHLFKVEEKIAAQEPVYEEVRESLRLELESRRLQELRREWLRALRGEAKIRVNERLLEDF
jgi:parvulin-like peptidyl-prolyl isomerase